MHSLRVLSLCGAMIASLVASATAASEDGNALYRARCAQCHGKTGMGKASMKAPSLVSPEVKEMSDEALRKMIQQRTNGEMERKSAHTTMKKRLTADQVSDLVLHIRHMQGK